jgi:hypothetical protein
MLVMGKTHKNHAEENFAINKQNVHLEVQFPN